jgi:hypothetical protein
VTRTPAPRLAAALAAVALVATALAWLAPGAAAQGTGANPRLRLVRQTPVVSKTDRLELQVAGDGAASPSGLTVRVDRYDNVHTDPGGDPRGHIDDWMGERIPPGRANDSVGPVRLDDLTGQVLDIPVTPDRSAAVPGSLLIQDAGVFPLVVRLQADGVDVDRTTTFLIRLPDPQPTPPLWVTPIIGIHAPVALRPDGTSFVAPVDRARIEAAQAVLAGHPSAPAALDLRPETLAALRSQDPRDREDRALRAALGKRAVVAPTYVDVDAEQWVNAGLRDQLERQRILAGDAVTQLLGEGMAIDAGTWIARRPLSATTQGHLADLGITRTVLPASDVAAVDNRAVAAGEITDSALRPFDVERPRGRTRALVTDERLNRRLEASGDPVRDAQATLADLTVLACGSRLTNGHCNQLPRPDRAVVLDTPDSTAALAALDIVLTALQRGTPNQGSLPTLRLADLDTAFALPPVPAARSNDPLVRLYRPAPLPPAGLGTYPQRLSAVAARVQGFRTMLADAVPADVEPENRDKLVQKASEPADLLLQRLDVSGAVDTPGGPGPYLDAVEAGVNAALGSIVAPPHEPIRLTSSDGDVQVHVENRSSWDVAVRIQLTSDKPLFPEGRTTVITQVLPGNSSRNIPVRVHAVSSGTFPVDLRVLSPDERAIVQTTRLEVHSTVVSSVGLALTVAAGVFLLLWWARHFRDTRRARKLVATDQIEAAIALVTGEVAAVGGPGGAHPRG